MDDDGGRDETTPTEPPTAPSSVASQAERSGDQTAGDGAVSPPRSPAGVGERITGVADAKDPDGLITLDDLPEGSRESGNLSGLTRKGRAYGDGPDAEDVTDG